jgi:hypothetical protein
VLAIHWGKQGWNWQMGAISNYVPKYLDRHGNKYGLGNEFPINWETAQFQAGYSHNRLVDDNEIRPTAPWFDHLN